MEENESGGFQDVGGVSEQFNSTEAIAAVADDGFLHGEEDEEDYEDLYNDVNVGEGFHQTLEKNEEDLGFRQNSNVVDNKLGSSQMAPESSIPVVGADEFVGPRDSGIQGEGQSNTGGGMMFQLSQSSGKTADFHEQHLEDKTIQNQNQPPPLQPSQAVSAAAVNGVESGGYVTGPGLLPPQAGAGPIGTGFGPVLFVGDLHWWTTDTELETELCKYGAVKEVKFFDEKASGKSKGYSQVEFYEPASAAACKDGMNGHMFNGRPCVVAHASPFTVKKMGEAQVNRNQSAAQSRRGPGMGPGVGPGQGMGPGDPSQGKMANQTGTGGFQGAVDNRGGYGRGNWGRSGPHGMARGPTGPMRNRPGGRGMMGNGMPGYGPGPPMLHAQAMMGQGFDPNYGAPMGRMGSYGGFPGAPTPPFSGILPSFPPGNVGLPGVAPHVNPAFFGRGMPMGMVPPTEPNMGMWGDPSMAGWGGDEYGGGAGRAGGDSSYGGEGEEGDENWQNQAKEKEKDWSGSTERRYNRDERDAPPDQEREKDTTTNHHENDFSERRHRSGDREKDRVRERSRDRDRDRERDRGDRHRDDRERHSEHNGSSSSRYKERDRERDWERDEDDEWKRSSRSTRPHQSKSRMSHEEDQRSSRSRDTDYARRRH